MNRYLKVVLNILITLIVVFMLVKIFNIDTFILKKIYPLKYSEYVEEYSKEYNVDRLLIYSIIKAESNFDENATSRSNANGLMQIMNETAKELDESINENDLYNPETNIKLGTKHYKFLYDYYDQNMLLAITAYNAGIGNVDKWIEEGIIKSDGSDIENIPYKETNNYVRKIIRDYGIYERLYEI